MRRGKIKINKDPDDPKYQRAFQLGREAFLAGHGPLNPVELWHKPELSSAFDAGFESERKRAGVPMKDVLK